jgi:hypothetical protein
MAMVHPVVTPQKSRKIPPPLLEALFEIKAFQYSDMDVP